MDAIVAVLTGLFMIALRQAVVALLIMVAPLAIVAYILPNVDDMFKKWKKLFIRMLTFYPLFSLLFGASSLAGMAIMMSAQSGFGILLGALIGLIGLFAQLYFELWRITFTSKEIRIRHWPFRERTYSYSMIKEVTKGYSGAENDYLIYCKFTDGKGIAFRMKDVNAHLAVKRLLSHRTIRNVSYSWTTLN